MESSEWEEWEGDAAFDLCQLTLGPLGRSVAHESLASEDRLRRAVSEGVLSEKDLLVWAHRRICLRLKRKILEREGDVDPVCEHLTKMCDTLLNKDMAVDKMARWVGFVQGVMWSLDLLSIEEEREVTRFWLHLPSQCFGKPVPPTVSV